MMLIVPAQSQPDKIARQDRLCDLRMAIDT